MTLLVSLKILWIILDFEKLQYLILIRTIPLVFGWVGDGGLCTPGSETKWSLGLEF